jgi:glycosyltransferase involved in cell wall biosynthesis
MRLLYLTRGCNLHDQRFLRAFAKQGVVTAFLSLENSGKPVACSPLPDGVWNLGHLGLPPGASTFDLDAALDSFKRLVLGFNPEIVLGGPVHDSGYLLARAELSLPWIVQSWAFDVFWEAVQRPDAAERSRVALQAAPALFADCAAVVRRCEELAGTALPHHFTMPWGLEAEVLRHPRHRDTLRRQLGLEGREVFLCTRGMEPIYGVETLLQAFRQTHRQNPNTVLLWAADGSLRPTVAAFAAEHGLANDIRLAGALDHHSVLDLFPAADFYVSCSASDGVSISLLEAMSFGLPVIVSEVGGNPEWVSSGSNGWLIPVGDAESFADALLAACASTSECRARYGTFSQDLVAGRADWGRNVFNFKHWLEGLMANHWQSHAH